MYPYCSNFDTRLIAYTHIAFLLQKHFRLKKFCFFNLKQYTTKAALCDILPSLDPSHLVVICFILLNVEHAEYKLHSPLTEISFLYVFQSRMREREYLIERERERERERGFR